MDKILKIFSSTSFHTYNTILQEGFYPPLPEQLLIFIS